MVLGVSRAVWIDADRSGSREAPLDCARRLFDKHGRDTDALVRALAQYDKSVAMHVLHLLHKSGYDVATPEVRTRFVNGPIQIRDAYGQYTEELGWSAK
jgi:hypothetical protein